MKLACPTSTLSRWVIAQNADHQATDLLLIQWSLPWPATLVFLLLITSISPHHNPFAFPCRSRSPPQHRSTRPACKSHKCFQLAPQSFCFIYSGTLWAVFCLFVSHKHITRSFLCKLLQTCNGWRRWYKNSSVKVGQRGPFFLMLLNSSVSHPATEFSSTRPQSNNLT